MLEPVSRRTYARIDELVIEDVVRGHTIRFCPCRVLPETVLNLRGVILEIQRLWIDSLGTVVWDALQSHSDGRRFFAGEVRLVDVQEGRPQMVAVWLRVPADYPRRFKVQLVDTIEPWSLP